MRVAAIAFMITAISVWPADRSLAGDLIYGCRSRPACGKVCKLVCDTETLVSTCYGCECDTICIPGPSRPGCKHCVTTCCGCGDAGCCGGCGHGGCQAEAAPKCEFCWRDWFASGCAKPRTVKVLTKYVAEKEVCSYHWEVVDACSCSCPVGGCGTSCESNCTCAYKPAPPDAQLGDVLTVTPEERVQLVSLVTADKHDIAAPLAAAAADAVATAAQPPKAQASESPKARASKRHRPATASAIWANESESQ